MNRPAFIHLTLLLGALLLFSAPAPGKQQARIHVILSSDTEIYARGLNGIQASMERPLRLHYLDALTERDGGTRAFFANLERNHAQNRLVITIGPRATRTAMEHLKKVPVLFSMVSAPRNMGARVGRHCGVSMDVPVGRYFETLKEISPPAKNVYAFYSTEEGKFVAGEGSYSDLRHGVLYHKVRVPSRSDLPRILARIGKRADAIHIIADPLYDRKRFAQVQAFSRKHGVVLMTSFASLVRAGATFGLTPDYFRLGTLTGEMANRVLDGRSRCIREGVRYSDRIALYLNVGFAKSSGVVIPESVRKRAALTRLANAGIRLFNQKKLRSARKVFEAILRRDPSNRAALGYRSRIISIQTGGATKRLIRAAEKQEARGNYAAALTNLQRVLTINPAHVDARARMAEVRKKKSEREREQAVVAARAGRTFDAIRLLQQALASLPGNRAAQAQLAQIRRQHVGRVQTLYNNGLRSYNNREYTAAINLLSNVLLIRPGHKNAREYLRLSRKKKQAIERLLRRNR